MGFFTGFFTGFSLTTTFLYLSIQVHRSTRLDQRNAIRDKVQLLNDLSSPMGAYDRRLAPREPVAPSAEPSKPSQPPMEDLLKHRWNKEVERLAHKAYESRWEDVRNTAVDGWKAAKRLVKGE
ncbi:hypothetical protein PHISP_07096 [Aspergillus sp. HF37]|nr:hypothetical protein PHISP_07096 [Aspergillus sp. HF37]